MSGISGDNDPATTEIDRAKAIQSQIPGGPFGVEIPLDPPIVLDPHVIVVAQVNAAIAERLATDELQRVLAETAKLQAESALTNAKAEHWEASTRLKRAMQNAMDAGIL